MISSSLHQENRIEIRIGEQIGTSRQRHWRWWKLFLSVSRSCSNSKSSRLHRWLCRALFWPSSIFWMVGSATRSLITAFISVFLWMELALSSYFQWHCEHIFCDITPFSQHFKLAIMLSVTNVFQHNPLPSLFKLFPPLESQTLSPEIFGDDKPKREERHLSAVTLHRITQHKQIYAISHHKNSQQENNSAFEAVAKKFAMVVLNVDPSAILFLVFPRVQINNPYR
jgi:hypothetical protein